MRVPDGGKYVERVGGWLHELNGNAVVFTVKPKPNRTPPKVLHHTWNQIVRRAFERARPMLGMLATKLGVTSTSL